MAVTQSIITDAQLQQYHHEGYTVVRELIPQEVCREVRARVDEVIQGKHPWPPRHFQMVDPARYTRPDGSFLPFGIQNPSRVDAVFASLAQHGRLQQAMGTLLNGPVKLFTDQALVKYGRVTEPDGGRTFYHQDSYYWKIPPEQGCNCWIPLDEVGPGAICLGIIPGSQQGWQLIAHESYYDQPALCNHAGGPFKRHRIPLDQVDDRQEVILPMQPGDGVFFTNYTWHRSEPNRTGRDLVAYAVAYQKQ